VATAVEARKLLRLGEEGAEFGVIASTLHGAHQDIRRWPSAAVSSTELAVQKRCASEGEGAREAVPSAVEALRCCCEVK
jgi:hypothetical protein